MKKWANEPNTAFSKEERKDEKMLTIRGQRKCKSKPY
jgi:hypothetical protein